MSRKDIQDSDMAVTSIDDTANKHSTGIAIGLNKVKSIIVPIITVKLFSMFFICILFEAFLQVKEFK